MKVNELSTYNYTSPLSQIQSLKDSKSFKISEDTDTSEFADILTKIMDKDEDSEITSSDITSILLDSVKAKEYLENTSGRQLLISMSENSIAGIITGNENN